MKFLSVPPFFSLFASERSASSITNSWKTTETCTTPLGPASCSTWRGPNRCTSQVRTCRRPPCSYPRRTRCRWSASSRTGRRGNGSWIPRTRTESTTDRRRRAPTLGLWRSRTTPTWRWRQRWRWRSVMTDATYPGRDRWFRSMTTPGTWIRSDSPAPEAPEQWAKPVKHSNIKQALFWKTGMRATLLLLCFHTDFA